MIAKFIWNNDTTINTISEKSIKPILSNALNEIKLH